MPTIFAFDEDTNLYVNLFASKLIDYFETFLHNAQSERWNITKTIVPCLATTSNLVIFRCFP